MIKGIIDLPNGNIVVIGLSHEDLAMLRRGSAVTVPVNDMVTDVKFSDVVVTMKEPGHSPTIPPMSPQQEKSTCLAVIHRKVIKKALKHKGKGTICIQNLAPGLDLLIVSGPTDEVMDEGIRELVDDMDKSARSYLPDPSLN